MLTGATTLVLAGVAGIAGLVAWNGVAQIWGLLEAGGWALLLVPVFHILPIAATTLGWRSLLLSQGHSQPLWRLGWYRWLSDAINALLPVAQVGGEVVRGRLMIGQGQSGALAAAAIIVDLTLGLVTLVVFILGGLVLTIGGDRAAPLEGVLVGTALFSLMIAGFYWVQRSDILLRLAWFMERQVGGGAWAQLSGGTATLGYELAALYAQPWVLARSSVWRLLAWVAGAMEMWLAVVLLGHSIGLRQAIIFEAVSQAFRNAGFAVPGALGVQEGGMIVAGSLVGLPPDLALSVSLVKRMRDMVLGLPAITIWFLAFGRGCRLPYIPHAARSLPGKPPPAW